MKNKKIIFAAVILLLLLVILTTIYFAPKNETYDENKEQDLGLAHYIEFLEKCIETQNFSNRTGNIAYCPEIPNEEILQKLREVKNLKGIKVCENQGCGDLLSECEIADEITFKSFLLSGGNSPTYTSIKTYDCGNKMFYLSESSSPPPTRVISRIKNLEFD